MAADLERGERCTDGCTDGCKGVATSCCSWTKEKKESGKSVWNNSRWGPAAHAVAVIVVVAVAYFAFFGTRE